MRICDKYKKNLVLNFYEELEDDEKAELEAHLHVCKNCRNEIFPKDF